MTETEFLQELRKALENDLDEQGVRENVQYYREYIEAEMPFLISDTLIHDERILDVYNFGFEFKDTYPHQDSVIISFDVDTIYGSIQTKEVI